MSTIGQKIFTTVLNNESFTFTADMGITSISIVLVSGEGVFGGSLPVPGLNLSPIPLIVGGPVTISSDANLPLEGVFVDCKAGGVINLIGRE